MHHFLTQHLALNPQHFPLLEPGREVLTKFGYFRRNDGLAIGLRRVAPEIFLMVSLCRIKFGQRREFCHQRRVPNVGGFQLLYNFCGNSLLCFVVPEDNRTVLRAPVSPLAVECGRVVDGEVALLYCPGPPPILLTVKTVALAATLIPIRKRKVMIFSFMLFVFW